MAGFLKLILVFNEITYSNAFEKKTMVSGIYFIFQSGKNNFQMCTHKIKIQR
jgi:hypothetical protein